MKLVTTAKTNTYELTYLVSGSLTDSEVKSIQATVQGLVKKQKGKILSEEAWGKKSLAYPIRKAGKNHSDASYLHLVLELTTEQAPAFEREIYLDNDIMRHLFVVAEKPVVVDKAEAEAEKSEAEAA